MRKAVLVLCLLVPLGAAPAASADVPPNELLHEWQWSYPDRVEAGCMTTGGFGVPFQYGAWGDYVDGCTSRRSVCPPWNWRPCTVVSRSTIGTETGPRYYQVTGNSRTWIYASGTAPSVVSWADRSCSGTTSTCATAVTLTIPQGRAVTTQCNGVRQHVAANPSWQHNHCSHVLRY